MGSLFTLLVFKKKRLLFQTTLTLFTMTSFPTRVHANRDPWIKETGEDCKIKMAAMSPADEKECEDYIKLVYNDKGKCSDLCQLYSDGRAEAAVKDMERLRPNTVQKGLFDVLSTPPVLAGGTKFTSIMSAALNTYTTTVRVKPAAGNQNQAEQWIPPKLDDPMIESLRFFIRSLASIPGL